MKFGSVCSGIEAASVAWHPLGWKCAFAAEIEKFPCAVLKERCPETINLGDMNEYESWPDISIDVLVGGTPCQDFSVAGLRAGMAGARGGLTMRFLDVARRYSPRWICWENVPGLLSIDEGRAFGTFLGGLAKLGYGFAYRILDAQHFGLAQRRERVFVIGCSGGQWQRAAAVLFERESMSGHPAPRREAGKAAPTIPSRSTGGGGLGTDFGCDGGLIAANNHGERSIATALLAKNQRLNGDTETFVVHSLRAEGFDASEDGTGIGTPLVPIAFSVKDHGGDAGELSPTLRSGGHDKSHANGGVMPAVAFANTAGNTNLGYGEEQAPPLTGRNGDPGNVLKPGMAVRRLTPRECERLQGFPDDYTKIPYRGKTADQCPDGPRYKALGNSMAVPVMHWIGRRISLVDAFTKR
jgi:DNA (cytosine-5)-methyltransferase 1